MTRTKTIELLQCLRRDISEGFWKDVASSCSAHTMEYADAIDTAIASLSNEEWIERIGITYGKFI